MSYLQILRKRGYVTFQFMLIMLIARKNEHREEKHINVLDAKRGIVLEVNAQKTKYMFVFCHQNAGDNNNINIP
jgi:hypothetical protein